jgi:hemerythrin-like domain-containing protein
MTSRPDLFTQIHKGIRSLLYDLGNNIQTADFSSRESSATALNRLDHDLDLLHEHGGHEDSVYFPPLKEHEGEVVHLMTDEHAEIGRKIGSVREAMRVVREAEDGDLALERGGKLNKIFNHFAAYYLRHMNHEEETAMPAMWRHFTDEELLAMRAAVQTSIPPQRYAEWLKWMMPSLNDPELVGFLGAMKESAPPAVMERVLSIAGTALAAGRWQAVRARAGI